MWEHQPIIKYRNHLSMYLNNNKYKDCIIACTDCATACANCTIGCLNDKEVKMLSSCIMLTQACADMCLGTVKAMSGRSEFARQICKLCAEICSSCANECQKYGYLAYCNECEKACRMCSESCINMTNVYLYA